ncbi:hypothetical protein [Clostridium algidicarnis]|uniref:hypothetical protein n=1 Tax=Clostridium algidicarnis TaxID=37659 RepID=UPI001C0A9CA7|nr:hypothetical protein [Clostridium algidicarnis]MBU3227783.1 hypothetical protein [Clostridium algidicarnis]MBU3251534.1 hypothetical protein [Clostridium algidicarnis]
MNKKKITIISSIVVVFVVLLFVLIATSSNIKFGFAENNYKNVLKASFKYFNGEKDKKIEFNQGEVINFEYSLQEEDGSLELQIRDEEGKIVESKKGSGEGNIELKVDKTQKYKISILAEKAKGKYSLEWSEK